MRDSQVETSLQAWNGFAGGLISYLKPNEQVKLSQVLEPQVSERFNLSSKAVRGILRRAEKRGKVLPSQLSKALQSVASRTTDPSAEIG